MNLIDRLIAKARLVQMAYGDNVFIISREIYGWTVGGQTFPDLEAAQEYVDSLVPCDTSDCTVIIDDLGPCDMDAVKKLAVPEDWLYRIKEENRERIRQKHEKERLDMPPMKDRRLI